MAQSELAQLQQRLADEYQSAKWGLTGLAYGTSKHRFITKRMENMGKTFETLTELMGSAEEAGKIVAETLAPLPDTPTRSLLVDFLRRTCDQKEETTLLIEHIQEMWNTMSLLGERFGLDVARKVIEAPSSLISEKQEVTHE